MHQYQPSRTNASAEYGTVIEYRTGDDFKSNRNPLKIE